MSDHRSGELQVIPTVRPIKKLSLLEGSTTCDRVSSLPLVVVKEAGEVVETVVPVEEHKMAPREDCLVTDLAALTVFNVDTQDKYVPELDSPVATFALSPLEYKPTLSVLWPTTERRAWAEWEEFREVYDTVRKTCVPNYLEARLPLKSGLCIPSWRKALVDYRDSELVDFLEFGWPLDYTAPVAPTPALSNHEKNPLYLSHVNSFLTKELSCNALLGPFEVLPFAPWFQTSAIMTRPKKNSELRRVIIDLSFPKGLSVNAGIIRGWYQGKPFTYTLPSIGNVVDRVKYLGENCLIWTVDLERAYRQLRVCPLSTPLLGINFKGLNYVDLAPPFGCRMSALACSRTTSAVVWILRKKGVWSKCYLDDFVGVEADTVTANKSYEAVKVVTSELGLDLAQQKCTPPAKVATWLGYTIDTGNMTVSIPSIKIEETLDLCRGWMEKKEASRKELRSLFGKLKHVSSCIPPAVRFLSRILDALRSTPFVGSHPLPEGIHKDISWFMESARALNGVFLIPPPELKHWKIECDSSLVGGGAWSATHYFTEVYEGSYVEQAEGILHLEALNVIQALSSLLPKNPSAFKIILVTDNEPTQVVLERGRGRDKLLNACSRQLWLLAAVNSTVVEVVHAPGKDLDLADALSRPLTEQLRIKSKLLCLEKGLKRIRLKHSLRLISKTL